MNRQARVVCKLPDWNGPGHKILALTDWYSYGSVNFFDAVRETALQASDRKKHVDTLQIEVRDEHDPLIPSHVYQVEVTREARILNPRGDADRVESKGFWVSVWDLFRGAK